MEQYFINKSHKNKPMETLFVHICDNAVILDTQLI